MRNQRRTHTPTSVRTRFPPPAFLLSENSVTSFPTTLTRQNSAPLHTRNSSSADNKGHCKSILKGKGEYGCELAGRLRRSKSERVGKRVVIDESKNMVRKFEKISLPPLDDDDYMYDHDHDNEDEEDSDNEYAKLSTEELNKRVEDFINRFNTQIRLQNKEAHS
ncbi:hypothetical protein LINPERPRIM_LOCUS25398 [Linum perenne]